MSELLLLLVLREKKSTNYLWVYKDTNNFLVKIGHQNNTKFECVHIDNDLLKNTIYSLVKVLKTHKYYYVNTMNLSKHLCSDENFKEIRN